MALSDGLKYLDPESMVPNKYQPRESFDEKEIAQLAESIRKNGVLQPILARPAEGGFEIVAGERRWRAARLAGLKRVPVIVQSATDDRALEIALVENLQRQDLDPVEEARAFELLVKKFGFTQDQIADRVGKSRPAVANALRILRLPDEVLKFLKRGELTRGHARALLALEDEGEILKMAERMLAETMTVRTAEASTRPTSKQLMERIGKDLDPNVRSAQDRLQSRMGARVKIFASAKGKGRIEIHFDSDEELSRLYDGLMSARF